MTGADRSRGRRSSAARARRGRRSAATSASSELDRYVDLELGGRDADARFRDCGRT